jgi:hypothetical protein
MIDSRLRINYRHCFKQAHMKRYVLNLVSLKLVLIIVIKFVGLAPDQGMNSQQYTFHDLISCLMSRGSG